VRTARCTLFGGSMAGGTEHIPTYQNWFQSPSTGEVYFRSDHRDSENRQIYTIKLGRPTAGFPKQNQTDRIQ